MDLNLYLITRHDSVGYDEAGGFLVAAKSPEQARRIIVETPSPTPGHLQYPRDEGVRVWASSRYSTVRNIGVANPGIKAGVLYSDEG